MRISIAVTENTPKGKIPENLADARYLFIVEAEENQVVHIEDGSRSRQPDVDFAKATLSWNCEAIVCGGDIEREAFDILADAQISRYDGYGLHASQVLKQLYLYQLPLIREYRGGPGCQGHSHAQKDCHHTIEEKDEK